MLYGGSRSGKTFLTVRAIVTRALKAPGSRHAIFRLRANHVVRSIGLDTLPKVLSLCFGFVENAHYKIDRSEWIFRLPGGSEIWLCGLDDKQRTEKVLGQEFATVYFNECSQIPHASVQMALTRLAQNVTVTAPVEMAGQPLKLRAWYDCNPPGTGHWSYKVFVEKKDPQSRQPLANPADYVSLVMNPSDNMENLPASYIAMLQDMPERLRKRFFEGRFVAELDNALWTLETIEKSRHPKGKPLPDFERVLVSVDPSGAAGQEDKRSDEIGITVTAKGKDGHYYVLEDASLRAGPREWAQRAILAYRQHKADRIIAEKNFGGAMVEHTIKTADNEVPIKLITASRGKVQRAEPISTLYDKGLVHHVSELDGKPVDLGDLEDQLCNFTSAGYMGDRSPDRADANIWGLSELSQGANVTFYGVM